MQMVDVQGGVSAAPAQSCLPRTAILGLRVKETWVQVGSATDQLRDTSHFILPVCKLRRIQLST